jgi:hypothetical protein
MPAGGAAGSLDERLKSLADPLSQRHENTNV